MMGELDAGVSLVRQIRSEDTDIPIYMLSSVGDNFSMTADYSALGLSGMFQKPIDPEQLLAILALKLR